jgi:hypothetical protein
MTLTNDDTDSGDANPSGPELEAQAQLQCAERDGRSTGLVRYDAMCRAISEAHKVDEVKNIRDKALAIQIYARQAQNHEAERQACEIRLRAERKCGKLLKTRAMAKGTRGQLIGPGVTRVPIEEADKLADLGISYDQSSRFQKLAEVPDETFEQAVREPNASTTGIIARHEVAMHGDEAPPADTMEPLACSLWEHLTAFEYEGLLNKNPNDIIATMIGPMQAEMLDLATRVVAWLIRLGT